MHYFDSRGVHHAYRMSFGDGVGNWRAAPGCSQPFPATLSADGNTRDGERELSTDDSTRNDDLKVTYRRVNE